MESLHIFVNSLRKTNDLGRDNKLIVVVLYKVFSKKDTVKCKFCSSAQGFDFHRIFYQRIMTHTHSSEAGFKQKRYINIRWVIQAKDRSRTPQRTGINKPQINRDVLQQVIISLIIIAFRQSVPFKLTDTRQGCFFKTCSLAKIISWFLCKMRERLNS